MTDAIKNAKAVLEKEGRELAAEIDRVAVGEPRRIRELLYRAKTFVARAEKAEALLAGIGLGEIEAPKVHRQPDGSKTYDSPGGGWVCFHCGHKFRTWHMAREHFGPTPTDPPSCYNAVLRAEKLEAQLAALTALPEDVGRLARRLDTFEGSDDLGNGDFSVCEEAAVALRAYAARAETTERERNALLGAVDALLDNCPADDGGHYTADGLGTKELRALAFLAARTQGEG